MKTILAAKIPLFFYLYCLFISVEKDQNLGCFHGLFIRFSDLQRVHLDIQVGDHAIDYQDVANKEKLSELQLRVRQLLDQVEQIQKEQNYQRVSTQTTHLPFDGKLSKTKPVSGNLTISHNMAMLIITALAMEDNLDLDSDSAFKPWSNFVGNMKLANCVQPNNICLGRWIYFLKC